MDAASRKKRSAAAVEFTRNSGLRALVPSMRFGSALPTLALAAASLAAAACGSKEDVQPTTESRSPVRTTSTKPSAPASGTPWSAGDEPTMAALTAPTPSAPCSATTSASTAIAPAPHPPTVRGEMAPVTATPPAPPVTIAPSHDPPAVKGKIAVVRPKPIGSASIAAPIPSPDE